MAFSLALKRVVAVAHKGFASSSIRPISVVRPVAAVAPSAIKRFFSDGPVFTASEVLEMKDPEKPFQYTSLHSLYLLGRPGERRSCKINETKDALMLRVDLPGFEKEHVKIRVEKREALMSYLIIEGETPKDEDESWQKYASRFPFFTNDFKLKQIKAEMKSGVLKVVMPKYKVVRESRIVESDRVQIFEVRISGGLSRWKD
ncbi:hypothetical protein PTKIN_Ptkin04bG0005600 [Pterospermum kingtungense]